VLDTLDAFELMDASTDGAHSSGANDDTNHEHDQERE